MESTVFLNFNDCVNIIEYEDKKNKKDGLAEFRKLDNQIVKLPYKTLADSAYDQTFKTLFTGETRINGINSQRRLMSLLNSLLFPDADENNFKIRDITYLPNDSVTFNETNNRDVLSFDVPCKCFCWEGNRTPKIKEANFCVDLEMQIKYESNFIYRFSEYKDSFRSFHQMPVVVLTFLNFKGKFDPFNKFIAKYNKERVRGIASFLVTEENKPLEILPNFFSNTFFFSI